MQPTECPSGLRILMVSSKHPKGFFEVQLPGYYRCSEDARRTLFQVDSLGQVSQSRDPQPSTCLCTCSNGLAGRDGFRRSGLQPERLSLLCWLFFQQTGTAPASLKCVQA